MTTYTRPELGDYNSTVCFKSVITGIEDTLGTDGAAVAFTRAGKLRGHKLAAEWERYGALEAIKGATYRGEQTESVLRGGQYGKFVFRPL